MQVARKMISAEEAKSQLQGTKKAVKKKRKTEIIEEPENFKIKKHARDESEPRTKLSAGLWRPIMEESIARVAEEIFPSMQTHQGDKVDIELTEMAYVLSLTMIVGNDKDTPRRGLRIKEVEISDTAKLCKECR